MHRVDQERLLSSRLLTFTDSQVFFSCSQGCNFQEQYHFVPESPISYTVPDPQASFDFEGYDLWANYAVAVLEYTKRQMTDPRDKLRAFNGITKFLERPFQAPFLFNLPSNLFEVALLWKPRGLCRRTNLWLPSWSWSGWDGDIVYELAFMMNNTCECTISQATITMAGTNTQLTTATSSPPELPPGWHRHFDDEELTIHYTSTDPDLSTYRYPRPLFPTSQSDNLDPPPSNILLISAQTASFLLTEQHSHMRDNLTREKKPCTEDSHELCYLAILDSQGRTAGTIIVGGDVFPSLVGKIHKFVGIARSTLSRMDDDPSWDDASKTFRHWTAQTQKPGVVTPEVDGQVGVPKTKFDWSPDSDEDDDEEFEKKFVLPNDDFFDSRYYSERVYWPAINVLLVSEEREGVVERVGVGKIHVDAFEEVARWEEIRLG